MTAVLIASMPVFPVPLPAGAPGVAMRTDDCPAAQRSADDIARALGFSKAQLTCGGRAPNAALLEPSTPRTSVIPNLITYSVAGIESAPTLLPYTTFQVPSEIPWVSANGAIVAYMKLDSLVLTVKTDDPLETAFALEDAGIPRRDIISEQFASKNLYVRVRPITGGQLNKILKIASAHLSSPYSILSSMTGFVKDCSAPMAALAGLAVNVARDRAGVMARNAASSLGGALGVVDKGGEVTDAVCGLGNDATIHQLAVASTKSSSMTTGLFATFVRSIDVAWKLNLPPNSPVARIYRVPFAFSPYEGRRPTFSADGRQSDGGALLPDHMAPDRVQILLPEWAYDALRGSRYASSLTYIQVNFRAPQPALILHAANQPALQRQVIQFRRDITMLSQRYGKPPDLLFRYSRQDCGPIFDDVIAQATKTALEQSHADRIRYLQNSTPSVVNVVDGARCTDEPSKNDDWSNRDTPHLLVVGTDVVVGY